MIASLLVVAAACAAGASTPFPPPQPASVEGASPALPQTPALQEDRAWPLGTWEIGALAGYARGKIYDAERTPVSFFQALGRAGFHFGPTGGGAMRGNFALLAEFHGTWIDQANDAAAAGLNTLGRYTWAAGEHWRPLVLGGVGLLYSNLHIPAEETQRNFTPQVGVGIQYLADASFAFTVEYRYHHISNKGATETNPGINSHLVLVGISWFR